MRDRAAAQDGLTGATCDAAMGRLGRINLAIRAAVL
jgi:hypothetical protein